MKVSDFVNEFLTKHGIKFVFELSGGMITHMLDSLNVAKTIKIISMKHEQSAAFAADAVGRLTGKPGVAMATSGPGATNLITGIGSSFFDSSPTLFITGQVNRNELKQSRPIRQLGFQETDIVSITQFLTKASWQIKNEKEVPIILEKAFNLSMYQRKGPVLVDIPMDIQKLNINFKSIKILSKKKRKKIFNKNLVKKMLLEIKNSKYPIILAGGGISSSGTVELFRKVISSLKIPVVYSLMAVDVIPYDDVYRVGLIGSYGNRWANLALSQSDLVLVLGSRLDVRQTGSQVKEFSKNKKIFHVDCDDGEINNRIKGCIEIHDDLENFLLTVLDVTNLKNLVVKKKWLQEIDSLKRSYPDHLEISKNIGINPNKFMHLLSKKSSKAAVYVADVGQHQMWAAQSLEISKNQRFITSGGMGAMGFGLPAAIGSAFATNSPVVLIAGDGGFQVNIQELQTVVQHKLPLKIVILNNKCHGMVRQFQESLFDKRYQSTLWGYSAPDFKKIGIAYGISSKTITTENQINSALTWMWKNPEEPIILQVMVDTFTNVYPKISFGSPNYEMEPKVS
jgi:acetolactate synthase I/II/III large subunit